MGRLQRGKTQTTHSIGDSTGEYTKTINKINAHGEILLHRITMMRACSSWAARKSRETKQEELRHLANFHSNHLLWFFTRSVVGITLLQIGLKILMMRVILDLLHELTNTKFFGLFLNCMWQSPPWRTLVHLRVSPLLFHLLLYFLDGMDTQFLWLLIHLRVFPFLLSAWCPRDQKRYLSRSPWWILVHVRVCPFLIIGFLVLAGFVGCLCCFQRLQNPNHTSH